MVNRVTILGISVFLIGLFVAPQAISLSKTEHKVILEERISTGNGVGIGGIGAGAVMCLDENGPRVNVESIPGGSALALAANYYAVATLDFDVSLSDVIDFGLWPFETIPKEVSLDDHLYGFRTIYPLINKGDLDAEGPYGSATWRSIAKQQVLLAFYKEYYVQNFIYRQTMAGEGRAADYSAANLAFSQDLIIEAGYPLDYPLESLPPLNESFWFNDHEQRPVKPATGLAGDTELMYLSELLHLSETGTAKILADLKVPYIRLYTEDGC